MKYFPIIIGVLILLQNAAYGVNTVTLGSFQSVGVSEDQITAVKILIRNEIAANGFTAVDDKGAIILSGSLTRLESNYLLQLTKTQGSNPPVVRQTKIANFDEIDVAIKRVAAAVLKEVSIESTAKRGDVLEKEQKEPSRLKSINSTCFAFGGGYTFFNSSTRGLYALGLSRSWDVSNFLIELRGDFTFGYDSLKTNISSVTIGAQYFWFEGNQASVFSGAEFGFGAAQSGEFLFIGEGDSAFGFAAALDTGVVLLRASDVNLELRMRLALLARELNGELPRMGSLLVGIRF